MATAVPGEDLRSPNEDRRGSGNARRTPDEIRRAPDEFRRAPNKKGRIDGKKMILLLIILIIILLAAVTVLLFTVLNAKTAAAETASVTASSPAMRDANAPLGQYEGKSDEEIQETEPHLGGNVQYLYHPTSYESGKDEAELRIENVPGNHYLMKVQITLDETGEVIYTSGLIEPNYHVQTAPLDKELAAGVYDATALFYAIDPDTETEVGTAGAKITITVES